MERYSCQWSSLGESEVKMNQEKVMSIETLRSLKQSSNEDLHIVSVGPSLRGLDFGKFRQKDIFTVNDALYHIPAKVMYHVYSEPPAIEEKNYKKALNYPHVLKFSIFPYSGWHQIPFYPGTNLAFVLAIQVGVDLGYKNIFLYGYDFSCQDGYVHWWDEKPANPVSINLKMEMLDKQKKIFDNFFKEYAGLVNVQLTRVS